jgi:hypothetical protein
MKTTALLKNLIQALWKDIMPVLLQILLLAFLIVMPVFLPSIILSLLLLTMPLFCMFSGAPL